MNVPENLFTKIPALNECGIFDNDSDLIIDPYSKEALAQVLSEGAELIKQAKSMKKGLIVKFNQKVICRWPHHQAPLKTQ